MTREEAKTAKVNVSETAGGPWNWAATFDNYDGAEDSSNRGVIGYGKTKDEAVKDLMDVAEVHYDWEVEDSPTLTVNEQLAQAANVTLGAIQSWRVSGKADLGAFLVCQEMLQAAVDRSVMEAMKKS